MVGGGCGVAATTIIRMLVCLENSMAPALVQKSEQVEMAVGVAVAVAGTVREAVAMVEATSGAGARAWMVSPRHRRRTAGRPGTTYRLPPLPLPRPPPRSQAEETRRRAAAAAAYEESKARAAALALALAPAVAAAAAAVAVWIPAAVV